MPGAAHPSTQREQREAVVAEFMLQLIIVFSLTALAATILEEIHERGARSRAYRRRRAAARKAATLSQ